MQFRSEYCIGPRIEVQECRHAATQAGFFRILHMKIPITAVAIAIH